MYKAIVSTCLRQEVVESRGSENICLCIANSRLVFSDTSCLGQAIRKGGAYPFNLDNCAAGTIATDSESGFDLILLIRSEGFEENDDLHGTSCLF